MFFDQYIQSMDTFRNDDENFEKIISEIELYDKAEFLERISALRLCYENRDKAVLIDAITTLTLNWLKDNNWNLDGISMSFGKFKSIINILNQSKIKYRIDPLEQPYLDQIPFYGNHIVMPGINVNSSFILNNIIECLYLEGSLIISQELRDILAGVLLDNFEISTSICKTIQIPEKTSDFMREVFIPSKSKLEENIRLIKLTSLRSQSHDLIFNEEMYSKDDYKAESDKSHIFLTHPYLEMPYGLLLLDISSIPHAFNNMFINLFDSNLLELVHNNMWKKIKQSLDRLKHKKIKESKLGIKLHSASNYKEGILNVSNDKLLIVFAIFGDHKGTSDFSEILQKRLDYLIKQLKLSGLEDENLFVLIVSQTLGGFISASLKDSVLFKNIPIMNFNSVELYTLSVLAEDSLFLPRFARANKVLQDARTQSLFGDFLSAHIFINNDMSFYMTDEIATKGAVVHFAIEETSEIHSKANDKFAEKYFTHHI